MRSLFVSTQRSKIDVSHHCHHNVFGENKIIIVSNFVNNLKVVAK